MPSNEQRKEGGKVGSVIEEDPRSHFRSSRALVGPRHAALVPYVFLTLVPTTLRSTFQQSKGQDTEECVNMASLDMT